MSLANHKLATKHTSVTAGADPIVFCTADDRYAMPLAVTLLSAAENLKVGHKLFVYVVDGGMTVESRERLLKTLIGQPIEIEFIDGSSVNFKDLSVSHHISRTAYMRLLADRWLPRDVEKAIYLDSDLVILSSLTEIWNAELGDNYCLAVPDIACPFVDAARSKLNFRKSGPYLATWRPIANYDEVGVHPEGLYFNSGVMVMNVARWRREGLGNRLLSVLRENARHVWCWDQYALNTVCSGQWGRLPLNWNVGAHAFEFPSIKHSPLEEDEFREMLENPAIIHFTTEFKPWDYYCDHPRRDLFFKYLDKTDWRGWRPQRPKFRVKDWWTRQAVWAVKHVTISYRKLVLARH